MEYNFFKYFDKDYKIKFVNDFKEARPTEQLKWVNKNFIIGNLYTFDFDIRSYFNYEKICCLYIENVNDNTRVEIDPNSYLLYLGPKQNTRLGYWSVQFFYNNNKIFLNICEAWLFKPVI